MTSEQNYECIKCGSIMTHTRAVPDVPELVRYDKSDICLAIENGYDALPSDDGEYVLHSQAEAIIAAEQMKLEATAKVGLQLSEQVEALEADIAAKDAEIEEAANIAETWPACELSNQGTSLTPVLAFTCGATAQGRILSRAIRALKSQPPQTGGGDE